VSIGVDVVKLGAGEERNLIFIAETRNGRGTAVDFADWTAAHCEAADVTLQEGPRLRGSAAVLQWAAQAPRAAEGAGR